MASINVQRSSTTTKILDQFYNTEFSIPTNEYDIVLSFFTKVLEDNEAAVSFTANLFQIAGDTGISALTYLENIKDQDELQLSMTMSYYLNSTRSNSTLLGVGQVITPNYYAARNVVI